MKKLLLLHILLLISLHAFSQTDQFDTDESGFTIYGQIGPYEYSTVLGLGASYTESGQFTMGISLGLEESNDFDLTSTAIKPFLAYRAVRQGENNAPLNVIVGASYQHNTFKDLDFTAGTIGLNLSVSHRIRTKSSFVIIPFAGLNYSRTKLDVDLLWFSNRYSGVGFNIGSSFLINKFFLTPNISFADGDSSFNLNFGILFPN